MKQYNAIWPLPGGVDNYFEALRQILAHLAEHEPLREEMIESFLELFPTIKKAKLAQTMLLIPVHLGYAELSDGKFRITDDGRDVLDEPDVIAVFHRAAETHIGFDEIVEGLGARPLTTKEIHALLKERVNPEWSHPAQPSYRVNWLRSLGLVEKDGMTFRLTETGEKLARGRVSDSPPSPAPEPTPEPVVEQSYAEKLTGRLTELGTSGEKWAEFEDAIAEAFEFLGFSSQKISGSGEPDVVIKAPLGPHSYTVVIDAKANSHGTVGTAQVNFDAILDHRKKAKAQHAAIVAVTFSGGNLVKWGKERHVRLIDLDTLNQILIRHEATPFSLLDLKPLFEGGGPLDETSVIDDISLLADEIEESMGLPVKIFRVLLDEQASCEAKLDEHSLYFLLDKEHQVAAIRDALDFLRSPAIAAITDDGERGITTRYSLATFQAKLARLVELNERGTE